MNEQKQEGALAEGARRANGAKAPGHRSERGRFSCQRKREAVLRLLRGESLETLCRELGTTAARAFRLARGVPSRGRGGAQSPPGG